MNKNTKYFLAFSALLLLIFFGILSLLNYIYRRSSLAVYNGILLFFIALLVTVILLLITAVLSIIRAYDKKKVSTLFWAPVRLSLRILLPFIIFLSGVFKGKKDLIRSFYVEVNNILVQSGARKYRPEEVLVLLPHCLQNSECSYKITNNIENCRNCGKCCIGDIASTVGELGIETRVVTGGTAARSVVSRSKPGIILSVACERDLAVGISDVNTIPVLGIINERPYGPCFNTRVDVKLLKERLKEILDDGG